MTEVPKEVPKNAFTRIWDKFKNTVIVTLVVSGAAVIAWIASLTDNLQKLWGHISAPPPSASTPMIAPILAVPSESVLLPQPLVPPSGDHAASALSSSIPAGRGTPHFAPSGLGSATPAAALENLFLEPLDNESYSLRLVIVARFENNELNTEELLSGIELNAEKEDGLTTAISLPHPTEDNAFASRVMILHFTNQPKAERIVRFHLGPRSVEARLGALHWQLRTRSRERRSTYHFAEGRLELSLPDPTWVAFRCARLLPGLNGNSLLEVVVDNRSGASSRVDSITFDAAHPSRDQFGLCAMSSLPQQVTFVWKRITAVSRKPAAWTTLDDVDVPVPVAFDRQGSCTPYKFKATVPVTAVIAAGELQRITLRIKDIPPLPPEFQRFAPDGPPDSLSAWRWIRVRLEPSTTIYPSARDATRFEAGAPPTQ